MGKILGLVAGVCLLLTLAASAAAEPVDLIKATAGYTYFNRPGAAKEVYAFDLGDCFSLVVSLVPGGKVEGDGKVSGAMNPMYSGIIPSLLADRQHAARGQNNVENCMVVRGWRVMRLDEAQGAKLWELDRAALAQQLDAWVGASAPPGEVVRSFANDAARRGTIISGIPSQFGQLGLHSLSMKAYDSAGLKTRPPGKFMHYGDVWTKWTSKPLSADKVKDIPKDMAVVVITLSGKGDKCWGCVEFQRVGSKPDAVAFEEDGRQDIMIYDAWMLKPAFVNGADKTFVFAAPPGKWRIAVRGFLETCLGAPAFEATAGEVLYLGKFDLAGETLIPDMALPAAQSQLAAAPDLAARIRPAAWMNGSTSPCHSWLGFYALEFNGFPFEPDYMMGSAFKPPAAP